MTMKRGLCVLLAVMLAAALFCFPLTASAESLYIRKIVSVVYDDSGSMAGDKWAYANYATQAFCGMLNDEDQLYITYMDDSHLNPFYSPEKKDLSAGGIQNSVNSIRSHSNSGSTPYTSVETAFQKLKGVQDANPNTQYWLVVITDGAFNEHSGKNADEIRRTLTQDFEKYTGTVMPNGTTPQVTFLGIGNVVAPEQKPDRGIFTYSASDAKGIVGAMSEMADKISGRTRLDGAAISRESDTTVRVSSAIPLLNIAVFVQGSDAKVVKASYSNELDIPVSRQASLSYPRYSDLTGGAFLLGDSRQVIGAGDYKISFDKAVDPKDLIVLFEPALEMRTVITVNGKEIKDYSELDQTMEGDKISVSCKVYEMGTDNEIDPSLLPPGTEFKITVSENGKQVEEKSGEAMELKDFSLKNADTQLDANITIDGFKPIGLTLKFKPAVFVPRVVYTLESSFGNSQKSVRLDDLPTNRDFTLCFRVLADGTPLKDPAAVRALNPVVSVSPAGNGGTTAVTDDGLIVFTPNAAAVPSAHDGGFPVDVTCTLNDGTSASETYTVTVSDYKVIPVNATVPVKKTGFFSNKVGVSFTITKDGVPMDKAAVEQGISVQLGEAFAHLSTEITVAPDGTVTVVPYGGPETVLDFWQWFGHWYYYLFTLPGEDLTVTLNHSYGSASALIDVTEEPMSYQILWVWLPLALELAVLAFVLWWIYCILAKPRFPKGTALYVGDLKYAGEEGDHYHLVSNFMEYPLDDYNTLSYRWTPTLNTKEVDVDDIVLAAGEGGAVKVSNRIRCKGAISCYDVSAPKLNHPADTMAQVDRQKRLRIQTLDPTEVARIDLENAVTTLDSPKSKLYYVYAEETDVVAVEGIRVIKKGKIFAYDYIKE